MYGRCADNEFPSHYAFTKNIGMKCKYAISSNTNSSDLQLPSANISYVFFYKVLNGDSGSN